MEKRVKQAAVLLVAMVLCCSMVFLGITLRVRPTMQEMIYKVHDLPTSATTVDLEEAGFVNLSELQSQPVQTVDKILFMPGCKQILTAFIDTGDDLIVWVFKRDEDIPAICMGTEYHVREQYESCCAMRTFAAAPDFVEVGGDVVEVWLRNMTPEGWPDVLLYKYQR